MRGEDTQQSTMFSYLSPEEQVPAEHPLRPIRRMVDAVLQTLSPAFDAMYASFGRPSIAPEKLLRSLLLQVLYSVRSERMLMEQLGYNLLFRWFVGLNMDERVWVPTVFTKNRDRLLESDIARKFFAGVLDQARSWDLMSDEHFSVDGTLIEAWAGQKSFQRKDGGSDAKPKDDDPGNPTVNFHGETRRNDTHDCQAYWAERHAEQVLAQHRDTAAPPPKLFLSLLGYEQPCPRLRTGLFELWLRTKPKPKGGHLSCGNMDDELPVLHWLLRERAAEIFLGLVGTHRKAIEEFVPWFLDKARPYTRYFTGEYKFNSFIVYAYGRPRYAAWAKLGKEVQDAATSLGMPLPEALRLPAMPHLEIPTRWSLVTAGTGISHRHLKRMAEALSAAEPENGGGDQ